MRRRENFTNLKTYVANNKIFQMLDVTIRVKTLQEFSVGQMCHILSNINVISKLYTQNSCLKVLRSAALICGEFVNLVEDPIAIAKVLLHPSNSHLPQQILAVFLQNALKLFSSGVKGKFKFLLFDKSYFNNKKFVNFF
jgi:hypothetical protein